MSNPGFSKRMLVICYDALLLAGVLFMAALPLPLIPAEIASTAAGKAVKGAYLLSVCFVFYGWFWTHGGQTLGMRAWNLYLVRANGKFINWPTAALRFVAAMLSWAALGLGFTWILLSRQRRSWHDLLSGTQIVHMPPGRGARDQEQK
ncbi:MAG: RDD family protein [Gammaproteobacteria bacterium]|nr:RDD family protein [Gammaproteobacteria bacterium]